MLRFFTNRKERQKEGKKESSSSSNGRKENGTISGKSFIKTILPGLGLGQTKGFGTMETLNRHIACRVLRGHQQFRLLLFPSLPRSPFFCSLKQTIKNLLKKSRRKITHKLVKKQSDGRARESGRGRRKWHVIWRQEHPEASTGNGEPSCPSPQIEISPSTAG